MRDTPIKTKSYAFAIRIVRLFQWLCKERSESFTTIVMSSCASSRPQPRPFVRKTIPCVNPRTSTPNPSMRILHFHFLNPNS
jgi:hypothetical protein